MNTLGTNAGLVLQLASLGPFADAALANEFSAQRLWEQADPNAWLAAHGDEVALLVTSVRRGCDAATISKLPRLLAICSWGVGYETIATDEARRRGIQVSNTPDVLDDCVADMAWALLLATARKLGAGHRYVREGLWKENGHFPLSTKVSGKRLGILGLGRIGMAIAQRSSGFGMDVRYHTRKPRNDVSYGYEASLESLASWCNFLVVACVGGPTTQGLVSAGVLEALGPRGIVVNVARGSVIDQDALIDALERGALGGVGLDVLDGEPGAPARLRDLDNVVLMPHVGSATDETREAMERLVVDNVRAWYATGSVITPVST